MIRIEIIAKSKDWLAVYKPAGLAVHGGKGVKSDLLNIVRAQENNKDLELVHRLDKKTSGLVLLAWTKESIPTVERFIHHSRKGYAVICKGKFKKKQFVYESHLDIKGKSKPSKTEFNILAHFGEHSLIKCVLVTGRNHQIRRHCAELGHPVLGDDKYGDFEYNKKHTLKKNNSKQDPFAINNRLRLNITKSEKSIMYLHAYDLRYTPVKHITKKPMKATKKTIVKAGIPFEFSEFLNKYNVITNQYFSVTNRR